MILIEFCLYKVFNTIQHFFRYEKIDFIALAETDDNEIVKGTSLLVFLIKLTTVFIELI